MLWRTQGNERLPPSLRRRFADLALHLYVLHLPHHRIIPRPAVLLLGEAAGADGGQGEGLGGETAASEGLPKPVADHAAAHGGLAMLRREVLAGLEKGRGLAAGAAGLARGELAGLLVAQVCEMASLMCMKVGCFPDNWIGMNFAHLTTLYTSICVSSQRKRGYVS